MKTFIIRPFLAAIGLFTVNLFAQDAEFREIGATPPTTETKPARKARFSNSREKGGTTARISFSDKTKPGTLRVNVASAEIDIEGTNGDEIIVTSSLDKKGAPSVDSEGYRRLDQEVGFELTEKDNIATLRVSGNNSWMGSRAEFKIQVPRSTNLSVKTQMGEGVEIDDIDGDIEVSTLNGEISLENVSGSVVANTMHGKIDAEFKRAPQKPVSLTTMNGSITLEVPSSTAANLRMRTQNGAIRTNFPESVLKTTTTTSTRSASSSKRVRARTTDSGSSTMTVVASNTNDSYAFSVFDGDVPPLPPVPSDGELVETIIEARKDQALDYADKGLAAAQKGINIALQTIDGIKGLSAEEKELIKRKIQSGANTIPVTVRTTVVPSIGGKTIVGELNGGGIDIQLTTMNGAITLKQEK